jgi:beta-glucanase (GH16 family)
MSRSCLIVWILMGTLPAAAQDHWRLVWSDEFNGSANTLPDAAKWNYDLGDGGPNHWGNQERETYTNSTENVFQDGNGNLVIRVLQTPGGGYTSARLKTQDRFTIRYGKIEARMKLPFGQGIWPAFWMLGANISTIGWPNCGEIDIMENIGREPSIIHGTVHGPATGSSGITATYTLPDGRRFSDDFHTFTLVWDPQSMEFFVDDVPYHRVTAASLPQGVRWVWDTPFFLLLNVAVGGTWPGYPDATSTFPQTMTVDYVRVYRDERPPRRPLLE